MSPGQGSFLKEGGLGGSKKKSGSRGRSTEKRREGQVAISLDRNRVGGKGGEKGKGGGLVPGRTAFKRGAPLIKRILVLTD